MSEPTSPRISDAQNTVDSRRLVGAQARMYSDAKLIFFGRIWIVLLLSALVIVTSASLADYRAVLGGGGGLILFFGSFLAETAEKRKRLQAAATQELFDTRIFQLRWNPVLTERPSAAAIAQAARRYRGGRDKDWYDSTDDTKRPLDVMICQATNLGWGASMHLYWACILIAVGIVLLIAITVSWIAASLSFADALAIILVPSLAPFKELISLGKSNLESWRTKEAAERSLDELWESALQRSREVVDGDVRQLQDKILILRQGNGYVPDWLDTLFHQRNEAAMRASVGDRITQAKRAGFA